MAPARLGIAGLASAALLLVAAPAPAVAADPGAVMVQHLNGLRANHGVPGFAVSARLARSSRAHARWMIRSDNFGHGATGRRRGEVLSIHFGGALQIPNVVRAWEGSDGHRNLLLDGSFRMAGAAYARGSFRGRRTTVWVVRISR